MVAFGWGPRRLQKLLTRCPHSGPVAFCTATWYSQETFVRISVSRIGVDCSTDYGCNRVSLVAVDSTHDKAYYIIGSEIMSIMEHANAYEHLLGIPRGCLFR